MGNIATAENIAETNNIAANAIAPRIGLFLLVEITMSRLRYNPDIYPFLLIQAASKQKV